MSDFATVKAQRYLRCRVCAATVMDESCRLSESQERAIYEHHENGTDDPGYRRFLSKLAEPLLAKLPAGATGLDFGCGPGPALAGMLGDAGMAMSLYDPFFYPAADVLNRQYDFVTCTEVLEHLHQPAAVFRQLDSLLKPGGWLGTMTCLQTDDARFANWHYRRDPTHVVFYREQTLSAIAAKMGWELTVPVKDVALFRKLLTPGQ
ncbi:2-polyprenyl-3-methyl-5-hydroxy-6-metoxy-1,4-benzoquinol methylase [Marinobacter salinus]|uniref:2-polyprenyl-3-methyl-5-hydroxy-6-metoxy-1, 4-benzoquinol methylase n=1 Tax=Marinobacter salinus TaxID=1874317 RepID=A0A1D9GLN1_9GAMM|nr:class I SAM-dependent methyltransferase [Marinobacter salinus]AOY88415.1 2-polyprenyl-3-methyl-5-hydroxy-6-metoxy-1,4-benzoquinol methylase [Marinobacter salinus]